MRRRSIGTACVWPRRVLPLPNDLPAAHAEIRMLRAKVAELQQLVAELTAERDELKHELATLVRRHHGRKSEKVDPDQQLMFSMAGGSESTPPVPDEVVDRLKKRKRRRRGRRHRGRGTFPNLPRVPVDVPAPEGLLTCECGSPRRQIGVAISERLDVIPAQFRVLELRRPKFVCTASCCDRVVCGPLPAEPIKRGLPTSALMALVVTAKYCDHLPLARQQAIYARQGVHLSKSTLADWSASAAWLLTPVLLVMIDRVRAGTIVQTDETGLPVLAKKACRRERLWILRGEKGDVVFAHTPTKQKEALADLLAEFVGYLLADAAKGFDHAVRIRGLIRVGCWSHTRRYFHEANPDHLCMEADWVLLQVGLLYEIERELKDEAFEQGRPIDPVQRERVRRDRSAPIVDGLFQWARQQRERTLPRSPLGKALGYMLNQENALRQFLHDGRLEMDNNDSERGLRQAVTGRKNWLFAGSEDGALAAAVHYSFVVSCKELGVDPFEYYKQVLPLLASRRTKDELVELTPRNWAARQRKEGGSKVPLSGTAELVHPS